VRQSGNDATIGDRATIGDGVILLRGFYLSGTKHTVTYVGQNKIQIGCHCKEISWFKENYEGLGRREGYSESEILEYKGYIELAEMFHKLNYNEPKS